MKRWERESLAPEEIDAVIDAGKNDEEKAMMTVLADTGMRVNELLRLRKDWVHWKKGVHGVIRIPIKEDYTAVPGTEPRGPKTKRVRNVPMTAQLRDVLRVWFKDHGGFFRTSTHVYNVCVRSGEAAGVCGAHSKGFRVTPHIFRHSFISRVYYEGGLRPEEIGQLVGHASGEMVEKVYLHLDETVTQTKLENSGFLES